MRRPILLKLKFKQFFSTFLVLCLGIGAEPALFGQGAPEPAAEADASQVAFSQLQEQANELVGRGQLTEAMPLLKELVRRVEKAGDTSISLDFPIFLIGTGHIQQFVNSGQVPELNEALTWYDKLEADYAESPKLKDALLKKVDVLRILKRFDEATALMEVLLLGEKYSFRLTYSEESKLLKDITETYYGTGKLRAGLPFFTRLVEVSREPEDRALGATASFEALMELKRFDDAMSLIPSLAIESAARYRPRFNVALLRASDQMSEQERLNDAAILLNLIKTTDLMIEFHETQLADRQRRLQNIKDFGGAQDTAERLQQEAQTLETNLTHLRGLPTLRNELLVRRARNYTNTGRGYEAYWMFYDLMQENPEDEQIEFFIYASFSNAVQLGKIKSSIEIGHRYREQFPDGEFYSDVSAALFSNLKSAGEIDEFIRESEIFLSQRALDPAGGMVFALYASHLAENEEFLRLVEKSNEWLNQHRSTTFEDGLLYWKGIGLLQTGRYLDAAESFALLIERFPISRMGMASTSTYSEDGFLRRGVSLFYAQEFNEARNVLYEYTQIYPNGDAVDQAFYFLGELESLAGNYELALQHLRRADSLTELQDIHDGVAFQIGSILENQGEFEAMAQHFEAYMQRFGEDGRYTDAIFQLGRAFEKLMKPNTMLALFRENIERFAGNINNFGVDVLVEAYAEKFAENKTTLERTVQFIERLENEGEFRKRIVSDRGFLFEHFYLNPEIDQTLYNRLRNDAEFGPHLANDLNPIRDILDPYRVELRNFPTETPESFFTRLLSKYRAEENREAEARMLMGLYRSDSSTAPRLAFDSDFLETASPRILLFIADYSRRERLDFAVEAWQHVLDRFPTDDSSIVALMRMADVSDQKGNKEKALEYLEQIATQFPGSPQLPSVILRQGELLSSMGRADQAREKYQYILRVPDWRGLIHARALYQTGQSFMAENKYAEAHGFFERTFIGYSHFGEWSAKAYLADARALLAMGAREDAVRTLREGIKEMGGTAPEELLESMRQQLLEIQS